ncbi:hypothetical protein ES703_77587 [subsurface metagenome]
MDTYASNRRIEDPASVAMQVRPRDGLDGTESIQSGQLCEDCSGHLKYRSVPGPFRKMHLVGNILPILQVFGYYRAIPAFSVLIEIDKPRVCYLDCRWPQRPFSNFRFQILNFRF